MSSKCYQKCKPKLECEGKPKVAFVCVHNSCRSQIAEALGKKLASEAFESYSAGTELKDRINPDAVRLMKRVYGIDMELTQRSKLLSDIPEPDVVVFMGCNVSCPSVFCQHVENWGLDDPSGQPDEAFLETIRQIEQKVLQLKARLS
ncbi:arsenate reductase ArsC [Xiamenia xianingshaonis]|uniref:Arsenate reductase ArsC n=1 Tax=Xiamenia xianingshaonis TaxID=2682776 RepID=A0ABX0IIQ5_9ACTN|nr:arsenate reductase ArsC [Xiamenia xianingshaonis]NHM14739.1 arsenate reductase ArsC [Xiamenia xianingshaonis]